MMMKIMSKKAAARKTSTIKNPKAMDAVVVVVGGRMVATYIEMSL
jgi:hypothetical protein